LKISGQEVFSKDGSVKEVEIKREELLGLPEKKKPAGGVAPSLMIEGERIRPKRASC